MKRVAITGVDAGDKAHALNLQNVTLSPEEKAAARHLIERRLRADPEAMTTVLEACGLAF